MNYCQLWRKIKRIEIPPDRRCVKTKWVFKINQNGIFCSRIVACGYSQIYGVDYKENYTPVFNDFIWCVLLILMLLNKYDGKLFDIKVTFLHDYLEEQIYMNCPQVL